MGKVKKINITLSEEELAKINDFARSDSSSRSGFIRRAVSIYIKQLKQNEEEKKRQQKMRRAALDIRKLREKAGDWNGVAEIRKWRETR